MTTDRASRPAQGCPVHGARREAPPGQEPEAARELPRVPGGRPLIGHAVPFLRDLVGFLLRQHLALGEALTFRVAGTEVASFCGPRVNAAVLNRSHEDLDRRALGRRLGIVFGPRVAFDAPEDVMAAQNRRLLPALQREAMGHHAVTMARVAERYTADWGAHGTVDLVTAVREMTALMTTHCLIGPGFGQAVGVRVPALLGHLETALMVSFAIDPRAPLPCYRRRDRARETLRHAIKELAPGDRPSGFPHSPFDVLTGKAPSEEPALDADDAADLVIAWLYAANETTAVYGAWTGALLLQHPEWLPVLVEEQEELFTDSPSASPRLLHRMHRLGHCMLEAERLHPSAVVIPRTAARDLVIEGYAVPRGHLVLLCPAASHRLPHLFRDPERYDPDRYLPGREEHHGTPSPLIGFSGGRAPCLGMSFAQMAVKSLWSVVLRTFDLELVDPGIRVARRSFMPPRQPCLVRYRRRTS
ncbi:cytochrome P450 [Streptomyces sp. UNOC14_S4]|uniref:cytochrome P450 n=1 Tax=Streptomyces sp. UNOC14_S4 TaxID=2872340 RepID=UPI0023B1FCDE|nr:cytochrome P450 [Streptomyces sp. UNOC14_S4]MCC3769591.1 cytochrome P450 [Streptomyces sp. UNOC14_S4]